MQGKIGLMGTFGGRLGCGTAALISLALSFPPFWVAMLTRGGDELWRTIIPCFLIGGLVGLVVRGLVNRMVSGEAGKSWRELSIGWGIALVASAIVIGLGWRDFEARYSVPLF